MFPMISMPWRALALGLALTLNGMWIPAAPGQPVQGPGLQSSQRSWWQVNWGTVRSRRRRVPRNFDSQVPYLLLIPRNTALLPGQPIHLRWSPVATAQRYRVTVTGATGVIWSVTVEAPETSVTYNGPPLEADRRYRVTIETDQGLSSVTVDGPVGFTVLSAAEAARVAAVVTEAQAQSLSPTDMALALAIIYLNYEHTNPRLTTSPLYLGAVQVLQDAIEAGNANGLTYLLQGDAFMGMGLPRVAAQSYEAGLVQARQQGDLSVQAELLDGLAIVAQGQQQVAMAIAYTEAAIAHYQQLGQLDQVAVLESRLAFLRQTP